MDVRVTLFGDVGAEVEPQAVEVVADREIDDARHRVGAVDGRGAAGDDLGALDQGLRQVVDVHGGADARGAEPAAVEHDQRTVRTQAPEVDLRPPVARIVRRAVEVRRELRHLAECGLEGFLAGELQGLAVDGHNRAGGAVVAAPQAGAYDDDFLDGFFREMLPGGFDSRLSCRPLLVFLGG